MVDEILRWVLSGIGLVCFAAGFLDKSRRGSFITAGLCAAGAAIAAHYHVFWVLGTLSLGMLWALITALPIMDLAWRAKVGLVLVVAAGAFVSVWPTLDGMSGGKFPAPQYIKDNVPFRIVAGLDLRGGMRLVYTVDVDEAIKDKRDRYYDEMRQQLAVEYGLHEGDKAPTREVLAELEKKVRVEKPRDRANTIVVSFANQEDVAKLDETFLQRFGEMAQQRTSDPKVVRFRIRSEVESMIRERAVEQAKDTINRRIDELGLREAGVTTRDEDIIIEVPGEDEATFQEIREIISQTARLEFKLLDDGTDFFGSLAANVNEADLPAGVSLDNPEQVSVGPGQTKISSFARIVKQPDETLKDARQRLQDWVATLDVPSDHEVGYGVLYDVDPDTGKQIEVGWRTYYLFSKAEITGDMLRDAQAVPDQSGGFGGWYVALTFTDAGGDRFEEITGANIKKRFAIILDGKVESAPVIQTKIAGGRAQITLGAADPQTQLEEARQLELVLRSGALPAPISPSNEQRIGPSLGADAISQGVKGAMAGSALVLIFMLVYYRRAGFITDAAVLFNLLIQLAVLASFGASMTLPGIAGLALTIGMAVDANVLINERIREELRSGKSPRAAVDAGYEKAFSAIFDGNITTLIAGLILLQYGTGPIKGFAVTLMVGLVANLFTGVFATRLAFDWWVRGRKVKQLDVG